jgi:CRP-like cAMP-binding protein
MIAACAKLESLAESRLLAALPLADRKHLLPRMQRTELALGETIYDSGEPLDYVYFPVSCVVSLVYTTENGATAEVGLIGSEGLIGLALLMGGETMPNRAVVVLAGQAIRLDAKLIKEEFGRGGALQSRLLRYTQALLTQIAQTAVCNRLHSMEQRLCRWLLMCQDRVYSNELHMTQEFISNMLGGRRQSVTIAAGHLQDSALIRYSRGQITILDRRGLEASACECYRVVEAECERLFRMNRSL